MKWREEEMISLLAKINGVNESDNDNGRNGVACGVKQSRELGVMAE